jgi:hypothetical protein
VLADVTVGESVVDATDGEASEVGAVASSSPHAFAPTVNALTSNTVKKVWCLTRATSFCALLSM